MAIRGGQSPAQGPRQAKHFSRAGSCKTAISAAMVSCANFSASDVNSRHALLVRIRGSGERVLTSSTCGSHLQHSKMVARLTLEKPWIQGLNSLPRQVHHQAPCIMTSPMPAATNSTPGLRARTQQQPVGCRTCRHWTTGKNPETSPLPKEVTTNHPASPQNPKALPA